MALLLPSSPTELSSSPQSSFDIADATPPSLQSLPVELLGNIASCLPSCSDRHYLSNLRLTCREIHSKIMFQFGSRYFKTLYVDITLGGLHRLLKVSRHHRFRSNVHTIYLFPETSSIFSKTFDGTTTDFVESGSYASQLDLGLGRLTNLNHIALEQTMIRNEMFKAEWESFREMWTQVIELTLSVIVKRQPHLKKLSIHNSEGPSCPPHHSILKTISDATGLLESMTTFRLQVCLWQKDNDNGTCMSQLIKILSNAKALTTLELSFDRSLSSSKVLSRIIQHVETFPKLETLGLEDMELSDELLIGLLRKHQNTIHTISLNCMFLTSGKWRSCFAFFSTELPRLKKLTMMNLYEGEPYKNMAVSFNEIHGKRAFPGNWLLNYTCPRPDAEEMEFLQTFQHVTVDDCATIVTLEDGEGEDIHNWLSMLVKQYEMVCDEPVELY